MFEICDVPFVHLLGETATGVIARFCGSLAVTAHQWCALLLAGYSLTRRRALPESRKNAHLCPRRGRYPLRAHPSNRGF